MFKKFLHFLRKLLLLLANGQHHHVIDYVAQANSVVSAIALFPQLYTTVIQGNSEGVSAITFFLISLNSVVWVLYGVHRETPPLVVSSSLNFVAATTIFLFVIL